MATISVTLVEPAEVSQPPPPPPTPNADIAPLFRGLPVEPLPPPRRRVRDEDVAHAPPLNPRLNDYEKKLALRNALRYVPPKTHAELAPEFAAELHDFGHIYMYRFIPSVPLRAYPIDAYPIKNKQAAAIALMVMNNLDPAVAQFPQELVTYGTNGQAFSNWAQFYIFMEYLANLEGDETISLYSGHPHGVFPSHIDAPRLVITTGMMVPNYSPASDYERLFALSVTMYGQMTAGSFCYIGPQGIVHGTTLTILNAGRKYLGLDDLAGKVFVTSGLGGMSGAQSKAAVICGCIGVVAEVSKEALLKRHSQGWVLEKTDSLDELIDMIRQYRKEKKATSIGFYGNIVDLWERLADEHRRTGELLVDLGSDQTSCHNPFFGGYYPAEITYEQSRFMMKDDPDKFRSLVQASLWRHVEALNYLSEQDFYFWDYGNAFLLEARRAGAKVEKISSGGDSFLEFRYPSYVQHIMGDIFSLGFGPFRWVCCSGKDEDLEMTDKIAQEVLKNLSADREIPVKVRKQYSDNLLWITEAGNHKLVVGSKARILYSDYYGRIELARRFNMAIREGQIKSGVIISRDHHDVSGTDSPFRETSNITDGSAVCADMAVQNVIGDAFRGATWVSLHNGGGTGWGEVMNGGFGLFLDGSEAAEGRATRMLAWDVSNGVTRRCWSGNENAEETVKRLMKKEKLRVTLPHHVQDEKLLECQL